MSVYRTLARECELDDNEFSEVFPYWEHPDYFDDLQPQPILSASDLCPLCGNRWSGWCAGCHMTAAAIAKLGGVYDPRCMGLVKEPSGMSMRLDSGTAEGNWT